MSVYEIPQLTQISIYLMILTLLLLYLLGHFSTEGSVLRDPLVPPHQPHKIISPAGAIFDLFFFLSLNYVIPITFN
jgi:hypothetical protein